MYKTSTGVTRQAILDYTSDKVCLQNTITTKTRMTADLDRVAFLLESGQAEQLCLNLENSVEETRVSREISTKLHYTKNVVSSEENKPTQTASNDNQLKTKHSIEAVSRSLDRLMASGKAMIEELVKSRERHSRQKDVSALGESKNADSLTTLKKRATYDLGKMADILDSDHKGSLVETLNYVSQEIDVQSQTTVSSPRIQRNTYDLSELGDVLDNSKESDKSLEELLKDLGCDEEQLSNTNKRQTYDLNDVSCQLDDSLSTDQSIEETLQQISLVENTPEQKSVQEKRKTYDLSDVSSELDGSMDSSLPLEDSCAANVQCDKSVSEKRKTYDLVDVSTKLNQSLNSENLEGSLELFSSTDLEHCNEMKRRTYDLTDTTIFLPSPKDDILEKLQCNNNTMECKTNNISLERTMKSTDKSQNSHSTSDNSKNIGDECDKKLHNIDGVLINSENVDEAYSNATKADNAKAKFQKIKTSQNYDNIDHFLANPQAVDKVNMNSMKYDETSAECTGNKLSNSKYVGEVVVNSQNLNKKRKTYNVENTKLSPSQWAKQMEKTEISPVVSMTTSKLSNTSGKVQKLKKDNQCTNSSIKVPKPKHPRKGSPKNVATKSNEMKQSKSVSSSQLASNFTSDMRSRSMSDPRSVTELKSSSTPKVSSNQNASLEKKSIVDSLKEMSPGVRNYLTNKLGLSDEQCIAVHRRLNDNVLEQPELYKMENRRTYSLDDVAQSLDIATSQGLPMTKVLDKLEFDHGLDDGKVVNKKNITKESEVDQYVNTSDFAAEDNIKLNSTSENETSENGSLKYVTLQPNIQSKFNVNRQTDVLNNGNEYENSNNNSDMSLNSIGQFKFKTKKSVYKPSTKLHSFSHLLGGQNVQRRNKRVVNETKRNTYTLESVAESLEKAQDGGETMIDALKRLSGSLNSDITTSDASDSEKRKTYSLEDVSDTLETGTASGVSIVDSLRSLVEPDIIPDVKSLECDKLVHKSKKKAPPKPKRTFTKPEIKFESDSFVIEYFTSPKKTETESAESSDKDLKNSVQTDSSSSEENVAVASGLQSPEEVLSTVVESFASKSSDKVVLDLDSLLVQLATERDKSRDTNLCGSKENVVCNIDEGMISVTNSELNDNKQCDEVIPSEEISKFTEIVSNSELSDEKLLNTAVGPGLPLEVLEKVSSEPLVSKIPNESVILLKESTTIAEHEYDDKTSIIDILDPTVVSQTLIEQVQHGEHIETKVEFTRSTATLELAPEEQTNNLEPTKVSETFAKKKVNKCLDSETELLEKNQHAEESEPAMKPDLLTGTSSLSVKDTHCLKSSDGNLFEKTTYGIEKKEVSSKPDLLQQVDTEGVCSVDVPMENNTKLGEISKEFNKGNHFDTVIDEDKESYVSNVETVLLPGTLPELESAEKYGVEKHSTTMFVKQSSDDIDDNHPDIKYMYIHLPDTNVTGPTNNALQAVQGANSSSESTEENAVQSPGKNDGVSRELNLLRLKLAEKQRNIEAQKQRTKEQLVEERKRIGENVFWFAVGKGRNKKEPWEAKGDEKNVDLALPAISKNSQVESSRTFTKQSPDEELPPSMEKLHDVSYNLKTINDNLRGSHGDLVLRSDTAAAMSNDLRSSERSSEQVVHEFRLSHHRPTHSSHESLLNKVQISPRSENLGSLGDLTIPRAPVMNYKSRISVPLTYTGKQSPENFSDMKRGNLDRTSFENEQKLTCNDHSDVGFESGVTKPSSLDFSDMDIAGEIVISTDEPTSLSETNQPSSPVRKHWDTNISNHGKPQLAVSKSNHILNDANRTYENNPGISQIGIRNPVNLHVTSKNLHHISENRHHISDNRHGISENNAPWVTGDVNPENTNIGLVTSRNDEILQEVNSQNQVIVDDSNIAFKSDEETPKKGLSLFIGDNSVGENGLTPEQIKKKERFLRHRQQKMEEEKIKKEALLEKKKRKEEKMSAIQIRREQEELSRQARLQEKKEQAELAKMERQKYEQQRKDNLSRTNYMVDGNPSGYQGYSRTLINHRPVTGDPHDGGVYDMPATTPSPSAFTGFTGVQSYVKPSGKTNRKLIINAISHVCLPGAVNKDTKEKCLQAMTEISAQHFLILFREGLKFRGLYSLDLENNQVLKVFGVGPRSVTEKMIQQLYKYNSGAKEFSKIPAKGFSLSVDGFMLQKSCWQSGSKPAVPSKTLSNYKSSSYRPAR